MGAVRSVRQGAVRSGRWVRLLRPVLSVTLEQMSADYRRAAELVRRRLRELRKAAKNETDPEKLWRLRRRIAELTPVLTQINELEELTRRYYERGYWRDEKYTF